MPLRLRCWISAVLWILVPAGAYAARNMPVITRLDTQYLDNKVNVNVHWESQNPVASVTVLAGTDQKVVKVDEYDNRRNPRGYTGEVTVVLNAHPQPGMGFISYVVYLEDDLRQKSEQMAGRAIVPAAQAGQTPGMPGMPGVQVGVQVGMQAGPMPMQEMQPGMSPGMQPAMQFGMQPGMQPGIPPGVQPGIQPGLQPGMPLGVPPGLPGGQPGTPMGPQPGFQFGTPPGGPAAGQGPGPTGMVGLTPAPGGSMDKIVTAMNLIDVPPYFSEIRVNLYQGNVTITGKVIDDKGLREIRFRIFGASGNPVQEQTVTNQGRVWQGTTNPFPLSPGRYKVIAKAVDSGGNSSAERTEEFEITGQGQLVQTPSAMPPMTAEQAQAFSFDPPPSQVQPKAGPE